MNMSLWKDIRKYSKTKNIVPLDERQLDTLKDLYMSLAKNMILAFLMLMISYGYMEMKNIDISFSYMPLAMSLIGSITYYYLIRFCYMNVIGLDENFEIILIPALFLTPFLFIHTISYYLSYLHPTKILYVAIVCCYPLIAWLLYLGANQVYKNGKKALEKELIQGEMHFRPRRQMANWTIIVIVMIACVTPNYDFLFIGCMTFGVLFNPVIIYRYGFTEMKDGYTINDEGVLYHKALWGHKGGFIPFQEIEDIMVQDTFNIGYAKDKIRIQCKHQKDIYLYPENAYRFYNELKNYI